MKTTRKADDRKFHLVKTWCESTAEGTGYLLYNGYANVKRILCTPFFFCTKLGNHLRDVEIIF
jgi:hypothetical protein